MERLQLQPEWFERQAVYEATGCPGVRKVEAYVADHSVSGEKFEGGIIP